MKQLALIGFVIGVTMMVKAALACSCPAGPGGSPPGCSQDDQGCSEGYKAVCDCTASRNTCGCLPN